MSPTVIDAAARSQEDADDLTLAHRYRLALPTAPRQSSFRVVALVFFELNGTGDDGAVGGGPPAPPPPTFPTTASRRSSGDGKDGTAERQYVVGTNDEPCYIGGSICAERAALVQLRFLPALKRISKVAIVTDAAVAISPGMLCREFMASHPFMSWDVPIVLGASVCSCCGLDLSARAFSEERVKAAASANLEATCSRSANASLHDFCKVRTTLLQLYPHPSPYVRLTAEQSAEFGESYASYQNGAATVGPPSNGAPKIGSDGEAAATKVKASGKLPSHQDAATSEDIDSSKPSIVESTETFASVRTTMSSPSPTPEDGKRISADFSHGRKKWVLKCGGEGYKAMDQQEAALYLQKMAVSASSADSKSDLHPISYGAAVLFSDGTTAVAHQKKALEYGCTFDAVGQLAHVIEEKRIAGVPQHRQEGGSDIHASSSSPPPVRPVLLVQSDQFGVLHAPFATARAYLSEHGHGDCDIAIHTGKSSEAWKKGDADVQLVKAHELAPSAPNIWGTESHAS